MKIGTKTILFGTHQFILHPIFVFIAWLVLYRKLPKFYELCAIITHDLGYWGLSDIDGEKGELHPLLISAKWEKNERIRNKFKQKVVDEVLGHSRFYSKIADIPLSKLFYADKLAIALYPKWFYLLLANLTGEIKEYMKPEFHSKDGKYSHIQIESQITWLIEVQSKMALMGLGKFGDTQDEIESGIKKRD